MVGIVLVSHSAKLAEGAAELAREMGGSDVRLEATGGLDLPDRPIGTDAVLVQRAIERAWSDDGVLVLMDLGSAVLSAEMALELLPGGRRERVLLCEAPMVEGAVAAAVAARLGRSLEEVANEARGGLEPKAAHLGVPPTAAPMAQVAPERGPAQSTRLVVGNELGLHARPAARLVALSGGFDADVRIANVTTGRGPANARSLNAVATLGVLHGHEIEVSATGPDARRVIEAITELAEDDFGDEPEPGRAAQVAQPAPATGAAPGALAGFAASPGIAVGPVRHLHEAVLTVPKVPADDPSAELRSLGTALAETAREIRETRTAVAARAGEQAAAIFDAHLLLLEDDELLAPVRRALAEGTAAATAWDAAVREAAGAWRSLDADYLRARAADVEAVGRRVLVHLLGVEDRPVVSGAGIVIAPDLTPGQTADLDREVVQGIATAYGAPTSHASVLARSFGIPAVVGLGEALLSVEEGATAVLDGDAGTLDPDPAAEDVERALARAGAAREAELAARSEASKPAMMRDGTRIEVLANVGGPEDVSAAVDNGAEGVGLLRTEFLFLGRDTMPTEAEQEQAYRAIATGMGGRPVTLRTLDVGGDKPLAYVPSPQEANPFLGLRGLRLGLARPELLAGQLRAALRVAADHPLKVMFPMVTSIEEVRAARSILAEAVDTEAPAGRVEVGIMVEVPSAALCANVLAPEVDFFSIGTNDLTQYALAAERGNDRVAALSDGLHPAVLRLIAMTADAGRAHGKPVAVCGELGSDAAAIPILLGLGVRELSVAPPAVPRVKRVVRDTDLSEAADLATRALGASSAAEVRALVATP